MGLNKIHIGFHKTGTTWLQKLIFPNLKNYRGRYYTGKVDKHIDLYKDKSSYEGCVNILRNYQNCEDHFISNEIFSSIRHEQLFILLKKYKYDKVLVTTRNFESLIKSRKNHKARDFYLTDKISNNIIDEEVRLHYSTDNLKGGIENLTLIDMDKIWIGDIEEIESLSEFLEYDIKDIILKNIHKKINHRKK